MSEGDDEQIREGVIEEARDDLVADFSHGMRKKLSLAAALLPAPRLLFLDEPFEGIDALASRQIKDLLHAFVSRGGTIFLTSHILEIVERLCDHIGIIANGRIVAQGTPAEIRASTDPFVHQFVNAEADGPVPFHYPAPPIDSLLGAEGA